MTEQFDEKCELVGQQLTQHFRHHMPVFGIPPFGLSVFHEIFIHCIRLKWICQYTTRVCKQIITAKRNSVAAVLDNVLEHLLIPFPWLTALNAVRNRSTYALRWLAVSVTVYPCILIIDTSESIAHLLWCIWAGWQEYADRKAFNSVKRGAGGSAK